MKLTFTGTRGYIRTRSRLHYMHSSLAVEYRGKRAVIDFGEDWLKRADEISALSVFVTHCHPDHAWGLGNGAPCPVFAAREAWEGMKGFAIRDKKVLEPRRPIEMGDMAFEAFPVEHSTRCPAVGFRVTAGNAAFFYAPDVVYIPERKEAFRGITLYIGDGASITRSMVRKSDGALFGHAPISTQLGWCRKEGVRRAVFTHCGSEIVDGDAEEVEGKVRGLAMQRGVEAAVAYDGLAMVLR